MYRVYLQEFLLDLVGCSSLLASVFAVQLLQVYWSNTPESSRNLSRKHIWRMMKLMIPVLQIWQICCGLDGIPKQVGLLLALKVFEAGIFSTCMKAKSMRISTLVIEKINRQVSCEGIWESEDSESQQQNGVGDFSTAHFLEQSSRRLSREPGMTLSLKLLFRCHLY